MQRAISQQLAVRACVGELDVTNDVSHGVAADSGRLDLESRRARPAMTGSSPSVTAHETACTSRIFRNGGIGMPSMSATFTAACLTAGDGGPVAQPATRERCDRAQPPRAQRETQPLTCPPTHTGLPPFEHGHVPPLRREACQQKQDPASESFGQDASAGRASYAGSACASGRTSISSVPPRIAA